MAGTAASAGSDLLFDLLPESLLDFLDFAMDFFDLPLDFMTSFVIQIWGCRDRRRHNMFK